MEIETLMSEITQRIQDIKDDYSLDLNTKEALIKENNKILVRCQQLFFKSELFCERVKNSKND